MIRVSGPSARIAAEIAKPRHLRANLNLKPRYAYFKTLYGIENQVVD